MDAGSQDASFRPSLGISVRRVFSIGRFLVGVLCCSWFQFAKCCGFWAGVGIAFEPFIKLGMVFARLHHELLNADRRPVHRVFLWLLFHFVSLGLVSILSSPFSTLSMPEKIRALATAAGLVLICLAAARSCASPSCPSAIVTAPRLFLVIMVERLARWSVAPLSYFIQF